MAMVGDPEKPCNVNAFGYSLRNLTSEFRAVIGVKGGWDSKMENAFPEKEIRNCL